MGYSARYHAISLIAVFLALAIGILIGVGFGDQVVSDAQQNIEESLRSDLERARSDRGEARSELRREREFSRAAFPALVEGRLERSRVGVIGIGGLSSQTSEPVTEALETAGATLGLVGVLDTPFDLEELSGEFAENSILADLETDEEAQDTFGRRLGRGIVLGGAFLEDIRGRVFERLSGRLGGLAGVVLAIETPEDLEDEDAAALARIEAGILRAISDSGVPVVGVARSDDDDAELGPFRSARISTVDNVETFAGRTALVLALAGAEGDFGVSDDADRLLPELLVEPDEDEDE